MRKPRKVPALGSGTVCAIEENSASPGRVTGLSLSVSDLRGSLLVGMEELAGFISLKNWTIAGR